MIYNEFTTFEEAKASQHYDHLFQKAQDLATASGVELSIIREQNLHIQDENGVFPLDKIVYGNLIDAEPIAIYEYAKTIWRGTTAWAIIYKYLDSYVYRKDHSDRQYAVIDIVDDSLRLPVDENGNVIVMEQGI